MSSRTLRKKVAPPQSPPLLYDSDDDFSAAVAQPKAKPCHGGVSRNAMHAKPLPDLWRLLVRIVMCAARNCTTPAPRLEDFCDVFSIR